MPFRERNNPRNGQKEYKYRYYFYADGDRHDTETGWFLSKRAAEEEGKRLKEEKETADRVKSLARRDTLLITAYETFIAYLQECADYEKSTTAITYLHLAKTIKNKYFPDYIQRTKVQDLKPNVFRQWMAYINSQPALGGKQVRAQKTMLNKFNTWLADNGYYISDDMDVDVDNAIRKVKLKDMLAHNKQAKGTRKALDVLDIEKIEDWYLYGNKTGEFKNLYWYALFMVLFFSGMRVEELVALQWKNVDLNQNKINICNAITEKEPVENALRRVETGEYKVKTRDSDRIIKIFGIYDLLLSDYRKFYQHYFALSDEDIEECFVFPNIVRKNPHEYQKHKNIVRHLQSLCETLKIDKATDAQMLRHSCAMFLVFPEPDGLNFTKGEVFDHFGHSDTTMLNDIYAKKDKVTKAKGTEKTFKDIAPPPKEEEKTFDETMKEQIIESIKTKDGSLRWTAHMDRMNAFMTVAEENKEPVFYYAQEDEIIVKNYMLTHLSSTLHFEEKIWGYEKEVYRWEK